MKLFMLGRCSRLVCVVRIQFLMNFFIYVVIFLPSSSWFSKRTFSMRIPPPNKVLYICSCYFLLSQWQQVTKMHSGLLPCANSKFRSHFLFHRWVSVHSSSLLAGSCLSWQRVSVMNRGYKTGDPETCVVFSRTRVIAFKKLLILIYCTGFRR